MGGKFLDCYHTELPIHIFSLLAMTPQVENYVALSILRLSFVVLHSVNMMGTMPASNLGPHVMVYAMDELLHPLPR